MLIVLVGCEEERASVEGTQGPAGQDGQDGVGCTIKKVNTASFLECEDGTSTEILKGQDGVNGLNGSKGDKGDKGDKGTNGTNGVDGKNGKDGEDGEDGKDGSKILTGDINPMDDEGEDGDLYLNEVTNEVWKKVDGLWEFSTNIQGKDGLNGADGIDGVNGLNGADGMNGQDGKSCKVRDAPNGAVIECEDGTTVLIKDGQDGQDGQDGVDGKDGQDGQDGVVLTTVKVKANKCTQVYNGIWVENINNGTLFDVYYNPSCSDNQGEYCDNVLPSFGISGSVDEEEHAGSGTTCWADNVEIQGYKNNRNSKDILVMVKDFN